MHGALSLAMVLAFAPVTSTDDSPDSTATARPTSEQCRTQALDFQHGLGPAEAPTLLRVYIDPAAPETNPLKTWLEVRRIAGERAGDLRVELVPSRGGRTDTDPVSDSVRVWFMAVASLGRAEQALRLLDRQDWQRIAAALNSPERRLELALELELDAAAVEARRSGVPGACLLRSLDRASNRLAQQTMGQVATLVGIVDRYDREQFQYIDQELTELRTQIDRTTTAPSLVEEPGFQFLGTTAPGIGSSARFDQTFPDTGVLVGGEALPHRLVIFVEDEEHGRLPDWLLPAMKFRTAYPGRLSVQLIAAGVGSRAIGLRRRLCAARNLGVEVEYLLHLAEPAAVRRLHETDLNELLQPVADSDTCSDSEPLESQTQDAEAALQGAGSRRGTDFGHPRGAWLDGRPVNPSDLDALEWQLDAEVQPSLIDWLTTPDPFASEIAPFEF